MSVDRPKVGPPIDGGRMRYVSVSAIKKFSPAEEGGCHRRWWFQYVAGKKEPQTKAQERGVDAAEKLEHYSRTGERALPDYLLSGIKFLPRPGSDLALEEWLGGRGADGRWNIEKAVALRDRLRTIDHPDNRRVVEGEIARLAGLVAAGVPIYGAYDCRHRRGEYVDEAGEVRREAAPSATGETLDHKTSKNPQEYGKTAEQLATDVQMVGYGVEHANRDPDILWERLSHVYYPTQRRGQAMKVTTLIPVDRLRRTWEDRVEPVVRSMIDVAKVTSPKDAEANLGACRAWNRDCPHRPYCPLTPEQLIADIAGKGDPTMSLFAKYAEQMNGAPPIPTGTTTLLPPPIPSGSGTADAPPLPIVDPARTAQIDAARQRFLAEDAAAGGREIQVPACVVDQVYLVDCEDGTPPCRMKHTGTSKSTRGKMFYFFRDDRGGSVRLEADDKVREISPPTAALGIADVLPPDASRHDALNAANPIPPEEIAKIADPELRARAEEHAMRHADAALVEAQIAAEVARQKMASGGPVTTGRCPQGKTRIAISADTLAAQRYVCSCGKAFEKTQFKPVKEGENWVFEIPGHNMMVTAAAPLIPAQAAAPLIPAQAAAPLIPAQAAAPPPIPTGGDQMALPLGKVSDYDRGFADGRDAIARDLRAILAKIEGVGVQ